MSLPGGRQRVQQLVEEHYAALYRYAYRLAGCATEADDLTQETFCQAQMKLDQLRDPGRIKSWLFSILRNNYLRRLRDHKQQQAIPLDWVGDLPDRAPDPLPEVEPERLQQVLGELPEAFRTPIILYYFEGFSYRDIAEQMELPMGTVMSRLARGKAHLRAQLFPTAALAEANGRARDGL